jgi:hypothetical protein
MAWPGARAGLNQAVVPVRKFTLADVRLDEGKRSHQQHENAVVVVHGGKWGILP